MKIKSKGRPSNEEELSFSLLFYSNAYFNNPSSFLAKILRYIYASIRKYCPFEMTHQKWLRAKADKEIEKLQNNFFYFERRRRILIQERIAWLTSRIFIQG